MTKSQKHMTVCDYCGKAVEQIQKRKRKRFCSDECRFSWWKENRDAMDKKAVYILVCEGCGREFESYGNKNRKYCTIDCFIDARFTTLRSTDGFIYKTPDQFEEDYYSKKS